MRTPHLRYSATRASHCCCRCLAPFTPFTKDTRTPQSRTRAPPRRSGSEHTVRTRANRALPALPVRAVRIFLGARLRHRVHHHPRCAAPRLRGRRGRTDRAQASPCASAILTAPSREPSSAAYAPLTEPPMFVSLCTDSSDVLQVPLRALPAGSGSVGGAVLRCRRMLWCMP